MSTAVITAAADQTVRGAILLLEDQSIRHLPVTEEGRLIGMVSDRDLREYRLPLLMELDHPQRADELMAVPLSEVMKASVISVGTTEPVRLVIDLMLEYGLGVVPVVEGDRDELVGIVSYVDILRALRPAA